MALSTEDRNTLLDFLQDSFGLDDLRELVTRLGWQHEDFPTTLKAFCLEVVLHAERRGQVRELLRAVLDGRKSRKLEELLARLPDEQDENEPSASAMEQAIAEYVTDLRDQFARYASKYVDLDAEQRHLPRWLPGGRWVRPLAELGFVDLDAEHCPDDEQPHHPVDDLRARLQTIARGVLLGEPGSGKTWTLWRLGLDYAALAGPPPTRVPLLVDLRDFNGARGTEPLTFAAFLSEQAGPLAPVLPTLRQQGRLVLLLDALNEMPRRCPLDGRDLLAELCADLKADKVPFLLSCRVRDYRDDLRPLRPLEQVTLRDLTPPQIEQLMVRRLPDGRGAALWAKLGGGERLLRFWQQVLDHQEPERFWNPSAGLPRYISPDDYAVGRAMHARRLLPLCRNPFNAFLLCEVYAQDQALPANRAALIARFVEVLWAREAKSAAQRGRPWPDQARAERALQAVARAMQQAGGTVLPRTQAREAIDASDADALLDAALAANLLAEQGDALRFSHQLVQEYFAAHNLLAALAAGSDPAPLFGETWWEPGVWRETLTILGEVMDERAVGANRAARWLAPATPELALDVMLRHGDGLTLADVEPETHAALVAGAWGKQEEADPRGRAAAFRVLGRLGADDRPGVGLHPDGLPDILWCEIPGGRCRIGGDDKAWRSLRVQEAELASFRMATYPITFQQFQPFIDAADGYHDVRWWQGLAEQQTKPGNQAFPYPNHPRERVSWYEAVAFSRWLSAKLGYEVRLPTEIEWERAARGLHGRAYPWGGEYISGYANIDETARFGLGRKPVGPYFVGQTSAVGIYPLGASPERVLDLAGNVWEWTLTRWADVAEALPAGEGGLLPRLTSALPNTPPQASAEPNDLSHAEPRVVRGAAWDLGEVWGARGARRGESWPAVRGNNLGFRLVAPLPPA